MPNVDAVIGKIGIKVLPDTSDFRRDAKVQLEKIEKRLSVTVATVLDITGAKRSLLEQLRVFNAENKSKDSRKVKLYTKIDMTGARREVQSALREYNAIAKAGKSVQFQGNLVSADMDIVLDEEMLRRIKRDIEHWRDQIDPITINVKLDLSTPSTTKLRGQLDVLTHRREVSIKPTLEKRAYAQVMTALAALSGLRVLDKLGTSFKNFLKDLDKSVPLIGTLALAIAGLGGWSLTAASNLASLSASLASIGPAALALPGIFGGMAIGATITVIAFKDIKKIVPEVSKAWTKLKKTISDNFWAKAAEPIRSMTDHLLPLFVNGFQKASTQIGGYFGNLATALKTSLDSELKGMFAGLSKSIKIAGTGTKSLASLITDLGKTGAGYLPRLAQWFVDITDKFSNFIHKASTDGRLKKWIDNAIEALNNLGRVVKNLYTTFSALGKAATLAGGSTLGTLAIKLEAISKVVNGKRFQDGLAGTFAAAHKAMDSISQKSGPAVTKMFETLGKTLETVLPIAGDAIGSLLDSVAKFVGSPEVQKGLVDLFTGLKQGIDGLKGGIAALSPIFGSLASVIGNFAAMLGPLLTAAMQALVPLFVQLAPVINTLVTALGGTLTDTLIALADPMATIAKVLAELIQSLGVQFVPIIQAAAPAIVVLANALAAVLDYLSPVLPLIVDLFLAFKAYQIVTTAATAIVNFGRLVVINSVRAANGVLSMASKIGYAMNLVATKVARGAYVAAGKVSDLSSAFMRRLKPALHMARIKAGEAKDALIRFGAAAKAQIKEAIQLAKNLAIIAYTYIKIGVQAAIATVKIVAQKVAQIAVTAATKAWAAAQWLLNAALTANPIGVVIAAVAALVAGIIVAYKKVGWFHDAVDAAFKGIAAVGKWLWENVLQPIFEKLKKAWQGVWLSIQYAWDKIGKPLFELIKVYINIWVAIIKTYIGVWVAVIQAAWDAIKLVWNTVGRPVFEAIKTAINRVSDVISGAWRGIKKAWNTIWDGMKGIVKDAVKAISGTVGDIWGGITGGLKWALNGAIGLLNSAIDFINKKLIDTANKVPFVNIPHIPKIPLLDGGSNKATSGGYANKPGASTGGGGGGIRGMARGGTVLPAPGGTIVRLAEAGKAETVVDTGKMNKLIDRALRQGGKGTTTEQNLHYHAAPGSGLGAEEDLFAAAARARYTWR